MTDLDFDFVVGIDPGVHTGVAVWDRDAQQLLRVDCMSIIDAMDLLEVLRREARLEVRIEDARLRTWFANKGREALQGAGSIKRDCAVWESWLKARKVAYRAVKPMSGATKLTAQQFSRLTGWSGRTNEHGRDAAMLVFGER